MREQVPDGDAMLEANQWPDTFVQRQQTALGREQVIAVNGFVDRRQREHGGGCDWDLAFKTRHSVAVLVDDGAVSADSDPTAR